MTNILFGQERFTFLVFGIFATYLFLKRKSSTPSEKTKQNNAGTQTTQDIISDDFIHLKFYSDDHAAVFQSMLHDICAKDLIYDKPFICVYESMDSDVVLQNMLDSCCKTSVVMNLNGDLVGIFDSFDAVKCISKNSKIGKALRQCVVADPLTKMNEIVSFLCAGVRCIALKKEEPKKFEIVSQGAIVRMIFQNYNTNKTNGIDIVNDPFSKTIRELGLGQQVPHSCNATDSAKISFEKMAQNNITSLPILDKDGVALGVISATDSFYAIRHKQCLQTSVLRYVAQSRSYSNIPRDVSCIVSCSLEDNLHTVLRSMLHEDVHHLYVINDDRITGVVSFVDILKKIFQ